MPDVSFGSIPSSAPFPSRFTPLVSHIAPTTNGSATYAHPWGKQTFQPLGNTQCVFVWSFNVYLTSANLSTYGFHLRTVSAGGLTAGTSLGWKASYETISSNTDEHYAVPMAFYNAGYLPRVDHEVAIAWGASDRYRPSVNSFDRLSFFVLEFP